MATSYFLKNHLKDKFFILSNVIVVKIKKGDNVANDIAIFAKDEVKDPLSLKYADIPPKIVFEIDIKASLENFEDEKDYCYKKTQKLLDFGVEKVVWVMSDVKKTLVASQTGPWLIVNWHDDVEVFDGLHFNLTQLLKEEGIEI
jgi:Uma2 family endonuclease